MGGEGVQQVIEFFKALSDLSRLRLIRILSSCGQEQYCVADLAKKLGITQPAVSQHLKVLRNIGIVEPRKVGFRVYYTANPEQLQLHKANMDALCKLSEVPCPASATCEKCPGAFCPVK
ncbi:MAG TPA: metalloregulator ArsR/SmtB family transcription factor [Desulfurivibrionaceae bacterium]|nr:metalloregulator ArsR/SmtB family transcription factor [Desulfurivibrionaceae bacterium]